MARGSEEEGKNLLFSGKPLRRKTRVSEREESSDEVIAEAERLYQKMLEGDYHQFFMALGMDKRHLSEYPFFHSLFSSMALDEAESRELLRDGGFPRRAKGLKQEIDDLANASFRYIEQEIEDYFFSEELSQKNKEKILGEMLTRDQKLLQLTLLGENDGTLRDEASKRYATGGLRKDLTFLELLTVLEKENQDIWSEMVRRELFHFIAQSISTKRPKSLVGIARRNNYYSNKAHLLHIRKEGEPRKSLCDKRLYLPLEAVLPYGFWRDGQVLGTSRGCPQCKKRADDETLKRLEEERSDDMSNICGPLLQETIEKLALEDDIRVKAREMLLQGASVAETQIMIREEALDQLAHSLAKIDQNRGEDSYKPPLWGSVSYKAREKISGGEKFQSRVGGSDGVDFEKVIALIHDATTSSEREKFFLYQLRAGLLFQKEGASSNSYERAKELRTKADTIIEKAIERFLEKEKS